MMKCEYWETEISFTTDDDIYIRGYDMNELIGKIPFSHMVHLVLTGELPSPKVGRIIDALMVASIDHGPGTPSVLTARTAASGGAGLKNAATAGMLALDKFHGAAVEDCMVILERVVDASRNPVAPCSLDDSARSVVNAIRETGERIPGFGHRQHPRDPRVDKLFKLTNEAGVEGIYIQASLEIAKALKNELGTDLPINIDGAVAAILCELHYPTGLGNAPFLIARFAGILAHSYEEILKMPRMRRIDPVNYGYSGPAPRKLSDQSDLDEG